MLVPFTLETQIKAILDNMSERTDNQEVAKQYFAQQLAQAIDTYIKSGTVVTVGSSTTQTGSMT